MTKTQERNLRYEKLRAMAARISKLDDADKEDMIFRHGAIKTCEGHSLSMNNTCMLIEQAIIFGEAIPCMVAGFKQWQKAGRVVRKGQHAIGHIMVPMVLGHSEDAETGETKANIRYKLVPVFGIDQTEPKV